MTPRFPLPPTSSPRMLGGLAATVLVAALALTGLVVPGGGDNTAGGAGPVAR